MIFSYLCGHWLLSPGHTRECFKEDPSVIEVTGCWGSDFRTLRIYQSDLVVKSEGTAKRRVVYMKRPRHISR